MKLSEVNVRNLGNRRLRILATFDRLNACELGKAKFAVVENSELLFIFVLRNPITDYSEAGSADKLFLNQN